MADAAMHGAHLLVRRFLSKGPRNISEISHFTHALTQRCSSHQVQFWGQDLAQGQCNMQPDPGIEPPIFRLVDSTS